MTFGRRFSAIRPFALISLLALLGLTGCAKVYDDTKGWGNDVEAWFRRDVIQGIKTSFEDIDKEPGESAVAQAPAMSDSMAKPEMTQKPVTAATLAPGATPASQEVELASTAPEIPATTVKAESQHAATPGHSAAKNIYPQTAGKPAAAPSTPPTKHHKAAKAGAIALHLASNKTKKAAIQEWSQLKSAFPDQLKSLHLEVARTDLGKKGVFYRVMAGPFPDKTAASQICTQLRKKEQYCAVMPAPNIRS